ncbi:unnamed protein product [Sympodiomycopsis kandeliae]
MLGMIRRKSSKGDVKSSRHQGEEPPLPGRNDASTLRQPRPAAKLAPSSTLPDLRLSGFDIDKMMGDAALAQALTGPRKGQSPLSSPDIDSDAVGVRNKRISSRPPPSSYNGPPSQPPSYHRSPPPSVVSSSNTSSSSKSLNKAKSHSQLSKSTRSQPPPSSSVPASPRARQDEPPARPQRSGPQSTFSDDSRDNGRSQPGVRRQQSQPSLTQQQLRQHQQRLQEEQQQKPSRTATHGNSGRGLMGRVGRAIKGESDDERRAREWEEARERQNERDRKERNVAKAHTAAEEARRKQAELEEHQRRRAAAERVERDQRAREAEAQRLRNEESQRKAEIKRKHDLDLRKKEQQERERIHKEIEARQKAEDAKRERIRKEIEAKQRAEDARLAKIKAAEDAEKARLKAIEDAKRAVEKAKQDYVQAIADGHSAIDQEDRDHIDRSTKEHEARNKIIQQRSGNASQDEQQQSSDSGVSIPSVGHGPQSKMMPTGSILENGSQGHGQQQQPFSQSPSSSRPSTANAPTESTPPSAQRPLMQKRAMTDTAEAVTPGLGVARDPSALLRSMSQEPEATSGVPPQPLRQDSQSQTSSSVHFAASPEEKRALLPPAQITKQAVNQPALRFASALTVGARGPPSIRSPLIPAPAVKTPWDAGVLGSLAPSNSTPTALAALAFQMSIADTSDPRKAVQGEGWRSHGLGDPDLIKSHYHVLKIDNVRLVKRKVENPDDSNDNLAEDEDQSSSISSHASGKSGNQYEEIWEEYTHEVLVFDLFEQLFTRTTPDVLSRIISHLDCADLKALRQSCKEVRFALDHLAGRELILRQFLNQVGYRTWKFVPTDPTPNATTSSPKKAPTDQGHHLAEQDPLPLSFGDVEAFLLSPELSLEYAQVAYDWLRMPQDMDSRVPRLARASTRAYSRVLSRLRCQPVFSIPRPVARTPSPIASPRCTTPNKHLSSSLTVEQARSNALDTLGGTLSPASPSTPGAHGAGHSSMFLLSPALTSPQISNINSRSFNNNGPMTTQIPSPWKPGRAALFRVWVPCRDGVWLSDEEIARCERELFLAGVWSFLKRGDIVWNVAMGDHGNAGKLIFDGKYLRDLSYAFDRMGHLPSWQNMFLLAPGYYHNIIRSSTPNPVIYLDILPWREEVVSSLRLVQDQVESVSAAGSRYRIAKWLYRSVAHVQSGQIISDVGLQCCDENWAGKIVFETEGTSEHAKEFLVRCAGPTASPQAKAKLLAMVLGNAGASQMNTGMNVLKNPATHDHTGRRVMAHTPFAVIRERSRPGLIWLRPVMERERLQ